MVEHDTATQVRNLVSEGYSATDIASNLGVSRQRVYQIIRDRKIEYSRWRKPPPPPQSRVLTGGIPVALNQSLVGTISELLVAADLLARGWQVYIPIARTGGHDLIADNNNGVLITIEVRSAHRSKVNGGKLVYYRQKRKDPSMYFALVVTGEPVIYEPVLLD